MISEIHRKMEDRIDGRGGDRRDLVCGPTLLLDQLYAVPAPNPNSQPAGRMGASNAFLYITYIILYAILSHAVRDPCCVHTICTLRVTITSQAPPHISGPRDAEPYTQIR